jgi:MFS family permease
LSIPATVRLFGWISLLTDAASEAIYPLLPAFLARTLGAGPAALGLIEGAAESASSAVKVWAGRWSDRTGRRRPLVIGGYAASALSKPVIGLAATWPQAFAVRLLDRAGKGVRGAPRDALLAAAAPPGALGRIFGFHRAMDHIGAVIGPAWSAVYLWLRPGAERSLFLLTAIPGAAVIALTTRIPADRPPPFGLPGQAAATFDPRSADERNRAVAVTPEFKRYLAALGLFTLGNSSDAFLLLRLTEAGLPAPMLPALWGLMHVIKASLAQPCGALSDRLGRRKVIAAGWLVYAVVYAGFATTASAVGLAVWFILYGFHFGLVDGPEKALVAELTPNDARGAAFGWFHATTGIGSLAASLLCGAVWQTAGPAAAFFLGAALAVAATVALVVRSDAA